MNTNFEKIPTLIVQRDKIIDAAEKCIINKGVNGSSMKEIQDASGMGAGQIYRHFRSKMQIVEGVIKKIFVINLISCLLFIIPLKRVTLIFSMGFMMIGLLVISLG